MSQQPAGWGRIAALTDNAAEHQIRLTGGGSFVVSCNCQRHWPEGGGGPSYPALAVLPFGTPAGEILAAYRQHLQEVAA